MTLILFFSEAVLRLYYALGVDYFVLKVFFKLFVQIMKLASYLSIAVSILQKLSVTNSKNEKSFITVLLTSYCAIYYSCKSRKIIFLTWGVPRYCDPNVAQNCYVLYGIACLYDKSRLTLTTSNNPCKFY